MSTSDRYESEGYRTARRAYILECAFEYFIRLLVSDSFLALLLSSLGFSEAAVGVISSLISLSFLFQMLTVAVLRRVRHVRRFAVVCHVAGDLFFMSLYLIPLFMTPGTLRNIVAVFCIPAAYFGNYIVTTVVYRWGNSFVEPGRRALFSSTKEMVSLLSGILVTLMGGYCLNRFSDAGKEETWFMTAAAAILVFTVCDLICLLLMKGGRDEREEPASPTPLSVVLKQTFGRKEYRSTLVLASLWSMAACTTTGFMGTYKNLLFSFSAVQIINACAFLACFAAERPLGRFSDKHSYAKGLHLGLILAGAAFLCNAFASPGTRWPLIPYAILLSVSGAGISENMIRLSYQFVDIRWFSEAEAIKNSVSGLLGFSASLLAGRLLSFIQANGNSLFGIPCHGQQVLSVISLILTVTAVVYNKLVIQKQTIIQQ